MEQSFITEQNHPRARPWMVIRCCWSTAVSPAADFLPHIHFTIVKIALTITFIFSGSAMGKGLLYQACVRESIVNVHSLEPLHCQRRTLVSSCGRPQVCIRRVLVFATRGRISFSAFPVQIAPAWTPAMICCDRGTVRLWYNRRDKNVPSWSALRIPENVLQQSLAGILLCCSLFLLTQPSTQILILPRIIGLAFAWYICMLFTLSAPYDRSTSRHEANSSWVFSF